jgi:hypothetical protein
MEHLHRWGVRGGADAEPAGHAKVYGQYFALVEMDEQVLGASVEPHHRSPREALGKALR